MTEPAPTVAPERIFLTGGSGRLGTELRALLPGIVAPPRGEMDVREPAQIDAALDAAAPEVVVHAAAYTDVAGAENDRAACWDVNVNGTFHVIDAVRARGLRLVHISTDYVFAGTTGGYREDDPPGPVRNYYALTKLAAEALARLVTDHLVIRTSFRDRAWPYPVAFADVHTSQDFVDVIAPEIARAVVHCREIPYDTLHIGTERKSVYDLARRRSPDVRRGSRTEASVELPEDISLDTSRWELLKKTQRMNLPTESHDR